MRCIERLSDDIHNSVRSGVVICDLTRIVEELVFNSLDSGATKVSIVVGIGSCHVKVTDNGSGIIRDDLVLLGERYATSKVDHLSMTNAGTESYFRGEALCSISHISLLEVVTKARGKPNGYKKIIKNCKCLFLGINDDIQDMGTAVSARDIFYNQPVRRKHMQSSPQKVLDSIKMSVLRIALVHLNVCFKVVDMECNHELLCTGPSPSPLPILFNNFGIEKSVHFYRLNASDGSMKLSGYISGPHETFSPKAIQYVYVNSRFICKGPLHKLPNQLAAKFDLSNSRKPTTDSRSEKQNRCHLCPTFILNLNCPRSYYDIVASERSRTSLEFKDWAPVLTLVETCIERLWIDNASLDMPVTFESGRKRNRSQSCQTSQDLSSPQLKKPSQNCEYIPDWKICLSSPGMPKFSKLKRHQDETFLSDTDYINQSCNESLADHNVIINTRSSSHLSDCSVFSTEHHRFVAYKSGKQEDDNPYATFLDVIPKFGDNISMRNGISADGLDFGDDIDINQAVNKSFLRSCSVRKSLPDRRPAACDENFEFENDDFIIDKSVNLNNSVLDNVKHIFCGKEMQTEALPPFPLSPRTRFDMHERSKLRIRDSLDSSLFKNMLLDSPVQIQKCRSRQQYLSPEWSPITEQRSRMIRFHEDDAGYGNSFENHSEICEDSTHGYSTWREDNPIDNNLNTKESWRQQQSSSIDLFPYSEVCSYPTRKTGVFQYCDFEDSLSPYPSRRSSQLDWSPLPPYGEDSSINYLIPTLNDSTTMKHECGIPYSRETMYNKKTDSIRSNSAPPLYRGKRRFSGLSNSFILSARSNTKIISRPLPCAETGSVNHTQMPAETINLKHLQKSPDQYQSPGPEKSVTIGSFVERPSSGRTPEVIRLQNGGSQKNQFINQESVECLDLKETEDAFNPGVKWRNNCSLTPGGTRPFYIKDQDSIIDLSSDPFHLSGDSLVPKFIDKTSLDHAKVLSQVDKKFIAVVSGKSLAVIDQHAADERIRLEDLRHKVLSGEMRAITYLDDERELVLPEVGYQLLHNYADQIRTWGWICNIHSHDTSSFTKNLDYLHQQSTIVKLLAVPCILGVNLTDIDLLEFLQQLADTDGSSMVPPSVHHILNSKACRGAIMFGDTLLPSECSLIVDELRRTALCFQCAHGRPTMVPLVNLDALHSKISKLGPGKSWHGLRQHELKLERSARRLTSAR